MTIPPPVASEERPRHRAVARPPGRRVRVSWSASAKGWRDRRSAVCEAAAAAG